MKLYNKAVLPKGFQANAVPAGIKKSGKLDLALFYSQVPAQASALFTTNRIQAAPLKVCQSHLKASRGFQAVIVNSGNANCFTGSAGLKDAQRTARILARSLQIKKESTLVASTGVIARRLPVEKIEQAIPALIRGLSASHIDRAKKAIMTTDTFAKAVTAKFNLGSHQVTICGVAKGSGMIAPNMATMLAFIFTDANITQGAMDKALRAAVQASFNCITVDGCMSTNDTVMLLANGQAENSLIESDKNFYLFAKNLNAVCLELAKLIIKDAEGASKFVRINVRRAVSYAAAKKAALAIANSNLIKTAIFAASPNVFGRIIAAVGASTAEVKEGDLKVNFSPLDKKEIRIDVSLNRGRHSATVYTADLTYKYIKINAEYN